MTNCAVTGAPKLSEKGAARSNSSSVNARTAAAASRLFRRKSSSAAAFVTPAWSWACLAFNSATTFRHSLPAGDCSRKINLYRVDAGNMVQDDADRTATIPIFRHRCTPLFFRESFSKGSHAGSAFLDEIGQ